MNYSYEKENKNNIFIFIYYLLVLFLSILKSKGYSILSFLLFIVIFLVFYYSLTINNYKILPTKLIGIILYFIRATMKVIYYYLQVQFIKDININFQIFILFIFFEKVIEIIYQKKRQVIFYEFTDKEVAEKYNKRIDKFLRKINFRGENVRKF